MLGEPFTESLVVRNARDLRRPTFAESALKDTQFRHAVFPSRGISHLVVRAATLDSSMSRYLVDCINADDRIEVRVSTNIVALHGDDELQAIRVPATAGDKRSGSTKRVAAAVGEGSSAVRSVHDCLAFAH